MKIQFTPRGATMPRLAALALGVLILAASCTAAHAADTTKQSLVQARDRMLAGAEALETKSYAYDGVTPFSLAFIDRKGAASITTPLDAGTDYAFVGVGDDDATDVDVIIEDSAGQVVAQDADDQEVAAAPFTPEKSGKYTVTLRLTDSKASSSACALAIFRKGGGYKLKSDSVRDTTDNMFDVAQKVHDKYDTIYNSGGGQWAIVGSVLKASASATLSGVNVKKGTYVFVAMGDEDMIDLDMKVVGADGKLIDKDNDVDNSAVCANIFDAPQTCSLELTNAKSDDFCLVMHAILHSDN